MNASGSRVQCASEPFWCNIRAECHWNACINYRSLITVSLIMDVWQIKSSRMREEDSWHGLPSDIPNMNWQNNKCQNYWRRIVRCTQNQSLDCHCLSFKTNGNATGRERRENRESQMNLFWVGWGMLGENYAMPAQMNTANSLCVTITYQRVKKPVTAKAKKLMTACFARSCLAAKGVQVLKIQARWCNCDAGLCWKSRTCRDSLRAAWARSCCLHNRTKSRSCFLLESASFWIARMRSSASLDERIHSPDSARADCSSRSTSAIWRWSSSTWHEKKIYAKICMTR